MRLLALFLALSAVTAVSATKWAVLVAGSQTWGNYRHQADIYHSYHVVSGLGIKDENIIMLYYDDIANNGQNPFKGQVFNEPTTGAGKDVYAGVPKAYTGNDVTPENFLAVLKGDASAVPAGKPVLKSTKDDTVFIFFSDHGGTGILAFPNGLLHASDLNNALNTGFQKGLWKNAVFYVEACEAGSMFENIIDPKIGVYVTTASNAGESSWGTYCPPDDKVNGKELGTCLGDLYAVTWMVDSEQGGASETLETQFTNVKAKVDKSHVTQYGDLSFTSQPIGNFQATQNATKDSTFDRDLAMRSAVPAPDIPLHLAYYNYLRADKSDYASRMAKAEQLHAMIKGQITTDKRFHDWAVSVVGDEETGTALLSKPATSFHVRKCGECCTKLYQLYFDKCGGFDDYAMKYTKVAAHLCAHAADQANHEVATLEDTGKLAEALLHQCVVHQ